MNLQVFQFKDAEVRTVIVNGEPLWVAKDVCDVLGIAEAHRALSGLDEDERHTVTVTDSIGRNQEMAAINESGLYSLILRSRKREAKAFKKWVTAEVLPTIRRTGAYVVPAREPLTEIDRLAVMLGNVVPALSGKVVEVESRLGAVEERQRITDPRAIEARMRYLEDCKTLLVFGTKGKPQAVSFPGYWRELKALIEINSFSNRAALTVPMMDRCIAFAREWCESRSLTPPDLPSFDAPRQAS